MKLKVKNHYLISNKFGVRIIPTVEVFEIMVELIADDHTKIKWLSGEDSPYSEWVHTKTFLSHYTILETFTITVDNNGTHLSTITT